MRSFYKKKEFWGTIIAILLLAYCVKDIRLVDIERLIERVNFYYLIPALVMEFIFVISKGIRWRIIVEKTKKTRMLQVIPLYAAGQVINIAMPVLTGQVGRLLLFSRKINLSKTFVFSTFILEILFDAIVLLFLIFLLSMAFVFPAEYRSISFIVAGATLFLIILLYLFLHLKDRIGEFGKKKFRDRWPGAYITLKKFANSFTRGIDLLRSTQYFSRTLFLSFFSMLTHILVVYVLFKAFGFELPFVAAILIMVINSLALLIPITPGNAGTFELAVVASLLAFKIAKADAVLYAMALHLLVLMPLFVIGLCYFHFERMSIKEIKEEGEKEEILEEVETEVIVEKDSL
jgi:uncharacterized protein (TIRG00374 family)